MVFWVVRRLKGQKMAQNDKNFCLLHLIFQEPYIIWFSFMVHMYVWKDNISKYIFGIISGGKRAKKTQNDKNFCLSHSVSQELYIIWLWFLVHMCKMMISPVCKFFYFSNFDFWGFKGGKWAKNDLKLPISVCFPLYLRNCRSYQEFDNDIYSCFSLFFWERCNIVNIKIILFFNGPL